MIHESKRRFLCLYLLCTRNVYRDRSPLYVSTSSLPVTTPIPPSYRPFRPPTTTFCLPSRVRLTFLNVIPLGPSRQTLSDLYTFGPRESLNPTEDVSVPLTVSPISIYRMDVRTRLKSINKSRQSVRGLRVRDTLHTNLSEP